MLKIEYIRQNVEKVKSNLQKRNFDLKLIDDVVDLDELNRKLKTQIQEINTTKNQMSKKIGSYFAQNDEVNAQKYQQEVLKIKELLEKLEDEQLSKEHQLKNLLDVIPNLLMDDVNFGKDENDNIELKRSGEPTLFNFKYKAHWDLAKDLNLIDFDRAAKISGSRFIVYKNQGAKLFRALQQFTLEHNIASGFQEILPPVIVLTESLYASGQLPKFVDDAFSVDEKSMFLSPTAEVQLLNMHRDEIINAKDLPILYTANTPCFRSEAGSAGRDTRGVIRQHQFWKSELVALTKPEESKEIHEKITRCAESILEKLNLPYRRILLCSGDTGFASAKTYDLEVWLPSYESYKEISSCSNCWDFQANRAKIRYKVNEDMKAELVHTLNGSSLAIDRLWAAVVENYQQEDGSIKIPDVLKPYFNNQEYIK